MKNSLIRQKIRDILNNYDGDLIYIIERFPKLEAVAEAAKNLKSEAYRISCFPPGQDSYEIGKYLLDELHSALEKLEKE